MQAEQDPVARLVREHGINPREEEVLRLLLAGHTNAQVAGELFISESTVKKHVNALYHKLGVANRLQLTSLVAGL
ncbi:MAG: helix-turn-helix transcriptional regulator [Atopobiaceae bacterium]|nr:helix-turn-helix transcriptional regulator [Atopobiaceae bacterium]MBQ6650410.1 helix-turn-helix transcriptional regulator [Atopobiaceae bacterium]